jgi:plastocyanin domain-containing protein
MNAAVVVGGVALIAAIYWWFFLAGRQATVAAVRAGVQEVGILVSGGYEPSTIKVRAGRPVRLVFDRRETNPCSEEIVIPAFEVKKFLPAHERTAVEFTPATPGIYDFSCGMGMLHGRVVVEG